uniref:NADH-ubiquinone oxidoreductase chain 4L n=1 Tax=Stenopirates sp. HL-2011 TaxID=1085627 RepID=G3K2L4_9HEMI|nr:NADH dehydrogenase subunit 4L [Stenopirates sp. HL-2011]AEK26851.1 NADH dehydrogenase subunit 4L [Stenopirates sp. HL-2011]
MNMYLMISFMFVLFFFCFNHKHLLLTLLILEYFVVLIFFLLINYLMYYNLELYFTIIFLVFSVCEGVLGLSILIMFIRLHGNDMFFSMNLLW